MKSRTILQFPQANIIKLICADFHWHIPFRSPKMYNIIQCKIYLSRPGVIDARGPVPGRGPAVEKHGHTGSRNGSHWLVFHIWHKNKIR
jgi:hypothetical protein